MTAAASLTAVHQLLPSMGVHDAISNEALLMQRALRDIGLASEIYAERRDRGAAGRRIGELIDAASSTALLYHFSVASPLPARLALLKVKRLVRYHNITPPAFFTDPTEYGAREACRLGREQIAMVGVVAEHVLAASHYNAQEIAPYCRQPPSVMPVLRDYGAIAKAATSGTGTGEHAPTLLFVGRIVPQKCQQDLLMLLYLAKKSIAPTLRLVLVGRPFSRVYNDKLLAFAKHLGLSVSTDAAAADVLIRSGADDAELGRHYAQARVFVSMSEHEGFGVPLVEAMACGVPVLAHGAAAVPETVGTAGLICDKNNWPDTLACLRALLQDTEIRRQIVADGHARAAALGLAATTAAFKAWTQRVARS